MRHPRHYFGMIRLTEGTSTSASVHACLIHTWPIHGGGDTHQPVPLHVPCGGLYWCPGLFCSVPCDVFYLVPRAHRVLIGAHLRSDAVSKNGVSGR